MKVYALLNEHMHITSINSEIHIIDPVGWVLIDDGDGDRYAHAQASYLPGPLTTEDGIPRYKWDETSILERSMEEIEAERALWPAPPKSEEEKLKTRLQAAEDALLFLMELQMGGMM